MPARVESGPCGLRPPPPGSSRTPRDDRAGAPRSGSAARRRHAAPSLVVAVLAALATESPATAADPPATATAIAAAERAATWVRTFSPPPAGSSEAALPVDGAEGACVVLRASGRAIGHGVAARTRDDDALVRDAVAAALSEAIGDPVVARLRNEMPDALGRQLTLELELAGALEPLPGRTYEEVARRVEPAADGIAMRRGDEVVRYFPAQLRTMNRAGRLAAMYRALAVELGLPPADLADLQDRFGVRVYRFATVGVAQRAAGRPFEATVRGMRLVRADELDRARVALAADRLTDHLLQTLWTGDAPLGLRGDYLPFADRYEPEFAAPRDQALVAYALARSALLPEHPPAQARRLALAAGLLLDQLALVDEIAGEADPFADPSACAAALLALDALAAGPGDPGGAEGHGEARLALTIRAGAVVRSAADAWLTTNEPETHPPHLGALLAAALVVNGDPLARASGANLLDHLWTGTPTSAQLDLLPWAAIAEARRARDAGGPSPQGDRLRQLAAIATAIQVDAPAELAGGFDLDPGRGARPDGQSLRILAGLTALAAVPEVVPGLGLDQLGPPIHAGLRFAVQLSVEDADLWAYRNAHRSVGGLRAAAWDATMPVAAQAVALIALVDGLASWPAPVPPTTSPHRP